MDCGDKTQQQKGVGLGLAISQELVTLMGGQIKVESEVETGSTFWFTVNVPIVAQIRTNEPAATELIVGYKGDRRHLLVADDKIENRLVLLNMLEPLGFRVTLVENGQELVDQALALHPDLIVTDLIMPVKTGIEAIQAIRQQPEIEPTPIIAISASVFAADLQRSQVAGADAFLPKPVELEGLLSLLAQYLDLKWQYKSAVTPEKIKLEIEHRITPPVDILERLLNLARFGDMDQIQTEALALANQNRQYAPFAGRLVDLAKRFEDKKITILIEEQLGENNGAEP